MLLVGYVFVLLIGKKQGQSEEAHRKLEETLKEIDKSDGKINELHEEKKQLIEKILEEAAVSTKALTQNMSEEEVIRRLREKGLVR